MATPEKETSGSLLDAARAVGVESTYHIRRKLFQFPGETNRI